MDTRLETAPSATPRRDTGRWIVAGAAGFLLVVGILAWAGYRQQQNTLKRAARDQLNAIADLKVGEIVRWRAERLMDANYLAGSRAAARDIETLTADPSSAEARLDLQNRASMIAGANRYERVRIFDSERRAVLSVPSNTPPPGETVLNGVAEALGAERPFLTDLHRDEDTDRIHASIFIPIFRFADRVAAPPRPPGEVAAVAPPAPAREFEIRPGARPVAVIQLDLDPSRFLFPLVKRWPTPSKTAETLLVRRDGDDALFINELRHRTDAALRLRLPMSSLNLPAAMALAGRTGVVEGLDYRGEPVLAALRPIPDTPWCMVSKVDQAEIYGPLRVTALAIGLLVLAFSAVGIAGARLLWRRRENEFLKSELAIERERTVFAQRYALLMENANDAITLANSEGILVEVNRHAVEMYRYPASEMRGMHSSLLRSPEQRAAFKAHTDEIQKKGSLVFETEHRRKDGSTFPVEVSARLVDIGGESYKLGIIRDITVRKAHETEIERLNRLYSFLSQVNQALVRARDRQEFLQQVCRVATEYGRFKRAWIGWLDDDGRTLRPVASAMSGGGQGESGATPAFECCSVAEEALRASNACVSQEPGRDPRAFRCGEEAERLGLLSCASVPILFQGRVRGTISFCAGEPAFFREKELETLREVALDVSYGLNALEKEDLRKRAEEALRESERRFHSAMDDMIEGCQIIAHDWRYLYINRAAEVHNKRPKEELLGHRFMDKWPGIEDTEVFALIRRCLEDRVADHMETEFTFPDGKVGWFSVGIEPIPEGALILSVDITERKRTELALRASEERYRSLFENMLNGLAYCRMVHEEGRPPDFIYLDVNHAFEGLTGLKDAVGKRVSELIPGIQETDPGIFEIYGRVARTGVPEQFETYVRALDMWFSVSVYSTKEDHFVAVFDVITVRKRAEEALHTSMERLRLAHDAAKAGAWEWDLATNENIWTDGLWSLFGLEPHCCEPSYEAWRKTMHPDDVERVEAAVQKAAREGTELRAEWRVTHRDASEHWLMSSGRPLRDIDGKPIRYLGIVIDITETKRAEAAVRESEARYRTFFATSRDSVFIASAEGRLLDVNDATLEMLGFAIDERDRVLKTRIEDFYANPAERQTHRDRIAQEGALKEYPVDLRRKDGTTIHTLITTVARKNAEGGIVGFQGTIRDVTDQTRYHREREATLKLVHILQQETETRELIRDLTAFLQEWTGCDAIGVRLREGDDYPYYETRGFSPAFVRAESSLCQSDASGSIARDSVGYPILDCMCGNVLCGRFDPAKPFFTPNGSFWSNWTTQLLATSSEADRLARTRNRCNGEGYESVALIALRTGTQTLGLLQCNDLTPNHFTPETISFLENAAGQIALALAQRQAQDEVRASEERYRLIAENTADLIWVFDLVENRFTYFSPSTLRLTGYTQEESLARSMSEALTPESSEYVAQDIPRRLAALASGDESQRSRVDELRVRHKNGSSVEVEVATTFLSDEAGRVVKILGVSRDIAERKRMESALRHQEMMLREAGELARVGGWEFDPVTLQGSWTEETARIHDIEPGAEVEAAQGMTFYRGEHRDRIEAAIKDSIERGVPYDLELELVSAKGRRKWVRTICHPVVENGKVVRMRGSFQDITERRQTEKTLRDQHERIALLNRIAQTSIETRSPEEMADALIGIIREVMPCDAAYLDAFDEANLLARGIRSYDTVEGLFQSVAAKTIRIDPQGSVDPILFFQRKPVRILREKEPERGLYMAPFGDASRRSASLLYVPMISRNRVVGSISVQSYTHNAYSEKEETFLFDMARQVGPALESILLYSETRRAEAALLSLNERLVSIAQMTGTAVESGSMVKVAERLVVQAREAFGVDACVVRELVGDTLPLLAASGVPPGQLSPTLPLFGLAREILDTRGPLAIADVATHPLTREIASPAPGAFQFISFAGIPLVAQETIIGILSLYTTERQREFSASDLEHLRIVANHAAIALSNERLFNSLRDQRDRLTTEIADRTRAEGRIKEQNERISLLNRVARTATESRSPEEMADKLLEIVRGAMPCDAYYVDTYYEATERTHGVRNYDTIDGSLQRVATVDIPVNRRGAIYREIILKRRSVRVLRGDERSEDLQVRPFGDASRLSASLLFVPMVARDKVVGILSAQSYSANAYTEEDEELLLEIARQAGPAFESIQLYTETKKAEEALRASESKLSNALSIARLGHWEYDIAADLFTFNDHFYNIFRTTAERVGGYTMSSAQYAELFVHPEDAHLVAEKVREALETTDPAYHAQLEHRIRYADGEIGFISVRLSVVMDDQGRAIRTIGANQDITERKRAEAERQRLLDTLSASVNEIYVFNSDTLHFEFVSDGALRNLGYTMERMREMTPVDLKPRFTAATFAELLAPLRAREQNALHFESAHRRADGTEYPVEVHVQLIGEPQPVFLAVIMDTTERRKLEDQLRQAQKMEAVGQLAGGVAHDFNNLLQVINGYTELVLDETAQDSSAHLHAAEVLNAGERARVLVSQLLAFSRKQVLRPKNLDLNEVIADLLKMIGRLLGEHIRVNFAPARSVGVALADRGQIEQVILNLSVNARDAMPDGGSLTIETQNVVLDAPYCQAHVWAKPGRYVAMSISDTGHGMDAETRAHLFEPFFTTKELGKGTGLGLATVYGIVKQHQGLIHVYSEAGSGTRFRIYLPRVDDRSDVEETDNPNTPPVGGTETILLAEDDPMVRNLGQGILERAGYTVLVAADGEEALRLGELRGDTIQLALLDVVMPLLGGFALYETLRELFPHMRFLFASGYSADAVHTNFVLKKGLELLQKPFSPDDLLRNVRRILDA